MLNLFPLLGLFLLSQLPVQDSIPLRFNSAKYYLEFFLYMLGGFIAQMVNVL